ncbi:MAG: hypothetical protein ACRDT7_15575 [Microbacterium sp.]
MESTTTRAGVDVAARRTYPGLALALAILSVPGSTMAWDLWEDGGGFVIGLPLAIAAIVLSVQARQRSSEGRGLATAAIVIGGVMVAMMVIWTAVETLS